MSTSTNTYGVPIRAGWAWVLPNSALDVPAIQVTSVDEQGVEIITALSINDYFKTAEANVGLFSNRKAIPQAKGTHSCVVFDSDLDDIAGFKAMLESNGLVDGVRDFTLDGDQYYYSMPLTKYDEFRSVSPLNQAVVEEPIV